VRTWGDFPELYVIDYEFYGSDLDPLPKPICYVAKNLSTGEVLRHWIDGKETSPLYPLDAKTIIIAFQAAAEMSCHLTLNFPFPQYILDLYPEFRVITNGKRLRHKPSLIGACLEYGLSPTDAEYKESMRTRILEGPPYSAPLQEKILDYCAKDVEMTANLFYIMRNKIDLLPALLRGKYMGACARVISNGIPIDASTLNTYRDNWDIIVNLLIDEVDKKYGVFEEGSLKLNLLQEYLVKQNIPWEVTPSGRLRTEESYFREQAKTYPQLKELQQLLSSLGKLRLHKLAVGSDNRNRCWLFPFQAKTGRNQPSSNKYVFGPAVWIRSLIKPEYGKSIAYIDYVQQEIAIAAALSGDKNMKAAYESGDTYIAFAKAAKAIPENGTKKTHPEVRDLYKTLMLGVGYGLSPQGFAKKAGITDTQATHIYRQYKKQFKTYWEWIQKEIDSAQLTGETRTYTGWKFNTTRVSRVNSLRNFPMQSTGADILRLAVIMCCDYGIKVCGPVHDALLIESPTESIAEAVQIASSCMEDASIHILDYKIRTEATIVNYPDRYMTDRGRPMWELIQKVNSEITPAIQDHYRRSSMQKELAIDLFETTNLKKSKTKMISKNLTERKLIAKLRKQSKLSHFEVMNLLKLSQDSDYDLEHEIDWNSESYTSAKEKILSDLNPTKKKTFRELSEEEL
jgi:DNA polymerase I